MDTSLMNASLYNELENISRTFDAVEFKSVSHLVASLRRWMKSLRRRYRLVTMRGTENDAEQWLYDNYFVLDREGKQLLRDIAELSLPYNCEYELPDVYLMLRELVRDETFVFSIESMLVFVGAFEQTRYIRNFEIDFLKNGIKIASIEAAFEAMNIELDTEQASAAIRRAITVLTTIDGVDFDAVNRAKNRLDRALSRDPSGCYTRMDDATRQLYRYKVSWLSLKTRQDELEMVMQYLHLAEQAQGERDRHVGTQIFADYDRLVRNKIGAKMYIPTLFGAPAVLSLVLGAALHAFWLPFLLYFPLWEVLRPFVEMIAGAETEREYLPRLALDGVIPEEAPTMVVLSALLPRLSEVKTLEKKLEGLYHRNGRGAIRFCVLMDLKQAKYPTLPEDEPLIRSAESMIRRLNRKYDGRFLLIVRKRTYSKTQNAFTGWERKRGAIEQLVRMIRGEEIPCAAIAGKRSWLDGVKYLIALDYDTEALLDSCAELVAVAEHPLNRPVIDDEKRTVTEGYGIISPHMAVDLQSSLRTPFTRVMGGLGGVSAYDTGSGDLYMDLYGEAIFAGKGLLDVEAFSRLLIGRFPEEAVLSHDILEGSFLRTAYAGDVEMTDGFPESATPFFKRLHRWIRGDFQNIPYIAPKIPTVDGKEKNPLNRLSRYKLFDNLRRALTPVISLLCFLLAPFVAKPLAATLVIVGGLSAAGPFLFGLLRTLIAGGMFTLSRKYYSKTLPATFELLSQAMYNLILLPKFAYNALDAAIRAVHRRFVSHRNLLEWTTAAQAEGKHHGILSTIRTYWFGELCGLFLCFARYGFLRLFGLFFLAAIPLYYLSKHRHRLSTPEIGETDSEILLSKVAAMWRFYCDTCKRQDNYLPPDNLQEAPIYRIAHKTSPTNIGLMLLSTLAARDLGLIGSEELAEKLGHTLETVERLDKWKGNLYNWYDTRSLAVLQPRYVSAVDSGNYACCLVALKEGLREYRYEDSRIPELITHIEKLIDETDISAFYDPHKRLLSIGYDASAGKLSRSYYDMLMSEARMTSYFAIAKRQVSKKHWGALGRTLARQGQFAGPVSWTGTMFEYFMPELLLHCPEGSLGYEGLRFCLGCQKRRARKKGIPFGISESGYYAFDTAFNYQYKAHGVQKIALKHGMNADLVVSPYSSYLTLPYDFEASLQNLEALEKLGAVGRYGHYEAVDFTRDRVGENPFAIVKSYMAHHVGMSILSIANVLQKNRMQKRFLADREMDAAKELLEEKLATGAIVFRDIHRKEVDRKPLRGGAEGAEYSEFYPQSPRVRLLSNGEITDVLTDVGASTLLYQGQDLLRRPHDLLRRPLGIFAAVKTTEKIISFTTAPFYRESGSYTARFDANSVTYLHEDAGVQTGMLVLLHPNEPAEQRQFVVKNTTGRRLDADLLIYFEPSLAFSKDEAAHPAFSKLFVHVTYDHTANLLLVKRKRRGDEQTVFLAAGFAENISFDFETQREKILERPRGILSLFEQVPQGKAQSAGTPDPAVLLRLKIQLPANGQADYTLLLTAGTSQEEAVRRLLDIRREGVMKPEQAAKPLIPADSLEGRLSSTILPQLLFDKRDSALQLASCAANRLPVKGLWPLGISGDLPIVLVEIVNENDRERAQNYFSCVKKLKLCGIELDLVFAYHDGGEYDRPVDSMLHSVLKKSGGEALLGARGGIHLVDVTLYDEDILTLLRAAAAHIAPKSMVRTVPPTHPYRPMTLEPVHPVSIEAEPSIKAGAGVFSKDRFIVTQSGPLPFSHILANPVFGTLMSDKALGFTWAVNSRENKLTPWYNDTMSDNRGELLLLRMGNRIFDLINGAQAVFSPEQTKYCGEIKGIKSNVTVSIGGTGMIKYLDVELTNTGDVPIQIDCAYYLEPVLGVNRDHARQISAELREDSLMLRNPFNDEVKSYMVLAAPDQQGHFTCDRPGFLSGNWEGQVLAPVADPCAAVVVKRELPSRRSEKIRFVLTFGSEEMGALQMSRLTPARAEPRSNTIEIHTPDETLDMLCNTWLPHQIVAARMFGRTGFYQCGGAYGFRDQLQDACAYLLLDPKTARRQIIRAAASQFEEGDVLHWWHNLPAYGGGKKGVRTRYSDDLLWLPYTVCEYLDKTGDESVLNVPVRYLTAPPLEEGEQERYIETIYSDLSETVYAHCKRAIERAYRLGEHGLLLIGCGDWNDGYNKVGAEGRGESVWLTQFMSIVLRRFAGVAEKRGEHLLADEYRSRAKSLLQAVDDACWDGEWYIRAFYDNGEKMGASGADECEIDSLPQSFAVLSKMPDQERTKTAIDAAYRKLIDREMGIIRLFAPGFDRSDQQPGYVKAYPVGVRENGGQYTHGAVWLAMAMFEAGETERGYELLRMLSPAHKYDTSESGARYGLEPYYMAADVYTNPHAYGRGGWSLYTGAAGWYYRVVIEQLLGIRIHADAIEIKPNIPDAWPGFELVMNYANTLIRITVSRGDEPSFRMDGTDAHAVPLDGSSHIVQVILTK